MGVPEDGRAAFDCNVSSNRAHAAAMGLHIEVLEVSMGMPSQDGLRTLLVRGGPWGFDHDNSTAPLPLSCQ